jgi:hypothetical protein
MVPVVVGHRRAGIQRLGERKVQLSGVRLLRVALADVVQKVPDRLVGDEQPDQRAVSMVWQDREQSRSLGVIALVRDRLERVFAQRPVWDRLCAQAPGMKLTRDRPQAPQQLADRRRRQRRELRRAQRQRVAL